MIQDSTSTGGNSAVGANGHGGGPLKPKPSTSFVGSSMLFFYLWVLFGVFVLNQGVVLREHGVNFAMQGFAFINALVFAKVMMLFEVFDPGRWLRKRPLIYPILYETLLLTILFLVAHVLEKTIEGLIRGKTIVDSAAPARRRRSSRVRQHHRHPVYRAHAVFRPAESEPGAWARDGSTR